MLTPNEKILATELLNGLEQDDLFHLAKTCTNGNLNPNSKEEAIEVITSYEEDVTTLLNRKKITKSLLFKYLHWKNKPQSINADKNALVDYIVQLWHSFKGSDTTPSDKDVIPESNGGTASNSLILNKQESAVIDSQEKEVTLMALKFSEWFYNLINEDFTKKGGPTLNENDFWNDCHISVTINYGVNSEMFEATSNLDAVSTVRGLVTRHNLFFSPNLTEKGVKGKLDSHGIVLILVCGTLHQGAGECVGIFEQLFSLIKDPLRSDNWKIKRSKMKLQTKCDVRQMPCLEDGHFGSFN